jgi:RHS repeat-associated protein
VRFSDAAHPFGGVHVATGGIDLRFPGQWFQAESGLHQNWMRDYDPTTGRYLEADPLGLVDGASVYGYARQNPGRWVDPRGECIGPLAAVCVGAAIGLVLDLAFQLYELDGQWECIDWWRAGQSAIVGGALGGLGNALGIEAKAAGAGRGLGNPFKGKTANQIADMFERKGFKPKGPSPRTGQGTYVNPSSGRGYHIDANHPAPKGPHVGVKPPRGSGVRDSRDFPM